MTASLVNTAPIPIAGANKYESRGALKDAIRKCMETYGDNCDLNHLDVSGVTDFRSVFQNLPFNGDISRWDVSNATSLMRMFEGSAFDGDISQWNVSKVENMQETFANSRFNSDVSAWDVSRVKNMGLMFEGSHFAGNLAAWDVQQVTTFHKIFHGSDFFGDVSRWKVAPDANLTECLSKDQMKKMPTSVFHWATGCETPAWFTKPQRKHWDNLFPVASGMGMSPEETVFYLHAQWVEKSTPALSYALPELELG